ncbi:DUF3800 domain-containing protein, partial [Acinetobacter baumannii]
EYKYTKEIKWANISNQDIDFYNQLIDLIFQFLQKSQDSKYRQFFMDRARPYVGEPCSNIEAQFKVYYQFIKHSFGFQFIEEPAEITIRLDSHSSHVHKKTLISFINELSTHNLKFKIEFINSKKSIPLQLCDLLMGSAGYYGNRIDWDLLPGKTRRSKNQIMKATFGKNVYSMLRQIDNIYRSSQAFNWFESTGTDGNTSNRFHHKLRIWKFIPHEHIEDKRWENDGFKKNRVRKLEL